MIPLGASSINRGAAPARSCRCTFVRALVAWNRDNSGLSVLYVFVEFPMRRVTLTQFLIEQQRAGRINPELRLLIEVVARAVKAISVNISKGALAGVLGEAGTDNVQGEPQKKLDVIANEILLQANEWGGHLAAMVDRKSTRLNSSHVKISYAVFC